MNLQDYLQDYLRNTGIIHASIIVGDSTSHSFCIDAKDRSDQYLEFNLTVSQLVAQIPKLL